MSLDDRHLQLRKRLDKLGFNQPLPLGAIGLVSALVDDLIQTTESLKNAKLEISKLLDAKEAWDLGVEPYKCDNSRLLSEVNSLHLKILKQQDAYELEIAELRVKARNLKYNNKVLDDQSIDLKNKIKDLEIKFLETDGKKQPSHLHRRPFISTVRTSSKGPQYLDLRGLSSEQSKCKCSCSIMKRSDVLCEIERLQNETKNLADLLEAHKKQLDARDREIMRLNALFTGGRPADALAKDCCYKNVNALMEDVQYLQKQKMELERKLSMVNNYENNTMKKMIELDERNQKLEQDLKDIEKVALHVENQANITVIDKDKEIARLRAAIASADKKLLELERGLFKQYDNSDYFSMKDALKDATEEKRKFNKQMNEATVNEQYLKNENEKLKLKCSKLKNKLLDLGTEPTKLLHEIEKLREDKENLQKDYNKLVLDSQISNENLDSINKLSREITERNIIIADLKTQIMELQQKYRPKSMESNVQNNISLQATIHRLERERDVAIAAQLHIQNELDNVKATIRQMKDAQSYEQERNELAIQELNNKIVQLHAENRELLASQGPKTATICSIKEENHKLHEQLKILESEYNQLKVTHSQTKILLEQTERSMTDQKSKISHSEFHLGHVEQHIQQLERENKDLNDEVTAVRSELCVLKAAHHAFEKEKDRLGVEIDIKTERVYQLEALMDGLKCSKRDLECTVDRLQRKLSNINSENIEKEGTLRTATSESEQLRRQIATLKRTCDNTLNENSRLANELADAQVALEASKKKQQMAVNDTETLKSQIKQYVTEVERVNSILAGKEQELIDMIDNYKSMILDSKQLEESKKSLTMETNEIKQVLEDAKAKNFELEKQLQLRNKQIADYERQVNILSSRILSLEKEIETKQTENEGTKDKLNEAMNTIRVLEKERSSLQTELVGCQNERKKFEEQKRSKYDLPSTSTSNINKVENVQSSVDGLHKMLEQSRKEMEQYQLAATDMSKEIIRLRTQVNDLRDKLGEEHDSATKTDALAKEYQVQVQELRRMITDERFNAAKSIDDINPYPTL